MNTNTTAILVIRILGAFALAGLLGMLLLSCFGRPMPEALSDLVSAAIGALGAMLAKTEGEQQPPAITAPVAADEPQGAQ